MKNTRKKILKLSAVLALAGMPAAVMANTVSLQLSSEDTTIFTIPAGGGVNEQGYGGPFNATLTYANGTTSEFTTFCVQTEVNINTGVAYNYTLSQTDSSGYLTLGAAYLYSSFINGSLASQLTGATAFGELQAAIWTLQNQPYDDPFSSNIFYTDAENALGLNNLESASNGAYGVEIMNIVDSNGNAVQNQLIEVPDACSTVILLGAMLPVGFFLRKKLGMVTVQN